MEISLRVTAQELTRSLREADTEEEREAIAEELSHAVAVLEELKRHRGHTPFFKIVGRPKRGSDLYCSVFDRGTQYVLGQPTMPEGADGGCYVHPSVEEAEQALASFPRTSANWSVPRALLLVRGDGDFEVRHGGKLFFRSVTPLEEVPLDSSSASSAGAGIGLPWRR